jgi:hypothetical protein
VRGEGLSRRSRDGRASGSGARSSRSTRWPHPPPRRALAPLIDSGAETRAACLTEHSAVSTWTPSAGSCSVPLYGAADEADGEAAAGGGGVPRIAAAGGGGSASARCRPPWHSPGIGIGTLAGLTFPPKNPFIPSKNKRVADRQPGTGAAPRVHTAPRTPYRQGPSAPQRRWHGVEIANSGRWCSPRARTSTPVSSARTASSTTCRMARASDRRPARRGAAGAPAPRRGRGERRSRRATGLSRWMRPRASCDPRMPLDSLAAQSSLAPSPAHGAARARPARGVRRRQPGCRGGADLAVRGHVQRTGVPCTVRRLAGRHHNVAVAVLPDRTCVRETRLPQQPYMRGQG